MAETAATPVRRKKGGKIALPGAELLYEQPQERSGKEYEAEAIAAFNELQGVVYQQELALARTRNIPETKVPKPPTYAVDDRNYGVFSSKLKKDADGATVGVGIVTRDGKKFNYMLE